MFDLKEQRIDARKFAQCCTMVSSKRNSNEKAAATESVYTKKLRLDFLSIYKLIEANFL